MGISGQADPPSRRLIGSGELAHSLGVFRFD